MITETRLEALAQTMDDDLRENLHAKLAPCSPAMFLVAYCAIDPRWAARAELTREERSILAASESRLA